MPQAPKINWPDDNGEPVRAARARLEVAAGILHGLPQAAVRDRLASAFDLLSDPHSLWRQELLETFPDPAGYSRPMVEAGLDHGLKTWTGHAFLAAIEGEWPLEKPPPAEAGLLGQTSVLLAGSIPMPSLLACGLPLVQGSPTLVKTARGDPITAPLFRRCLAEIDPHLARCLEVVSFPSSDEASLKIFLEADCVVANGTDETIESIAERLKASQTLVAYGHKFSVAVVLSRGLRARTDLETVANALALDVALWDQLGCLSPVCVYILGDDSASQVSSLARAMSQAMAALENRLPRGPVPKTASAAIRQARDEASLRAASDPKIMLYTSEDSAWTVVGEANTQWRPTPLHRFLRIHPARNLAELKSTLAPLARHLSCVGVGGRSADPEAALDLGSEMTRLGASRFCELGQMQAPPIDWPRDGRPLLVSLAPG